MANYYVPVTSPAHKGESIVSHKLDHPFSKRSTDHIVFSFGSDFKPLIEFGSLALANMVNERNVERLRQSISFMSKHQQKVIRKDFDILAENDIHCTPLTPPIVEIGYRLLKAFQSSGEVSKTTFRNTWNDLLILATAWDQEDILWSEDNQLNRFAASTFGEHTEQLDGVMKIRFSPRAFRAKKRYESKNYVNKGWRATFQTGRQQAW